MVAGLPGEVKEAMRIEQRGLIFDAEGRSASERIAFFPGLCLLHDGTALAGFQLGSAKHAPDSTIRLCRSIDGGTNWQEVSARFETHLDGVPGSLAAPELIECEPGRLLLFATWFDRSDPQRPLFDPVTEGILHSRLVYAFSQDGGEIWSSWQILDTPGLSGCASTGPLLRWCDGSLAYAFESFKEFDDPKPARHAAWLVHSRDGGRHFSTPWKVAQHPQHEVYYWDQRLCVAGDAGEMLALFWTHDLVRKRDLCVHLARGDLTANGLTIAAPRATSIPGQIAAPLFLDRGRLVAFVVDRDRPGTMKLWQSPDGGETWPEKDVLVVHTHEERSRLSQGRENIDFREYWEDMGKWSFGHPVVRRLGQEHLLLSWYAGNPEAMSIHWARVRLVD